MAARRLIMVLLVLLFVSSLAAALIPVTRSGDSTSSTTTTQPANADTAGRLLTRRIDGRDNKPATIRMRLGDQLQLSVDAARPNQVEIPAFDQLEPVDLGAPATFDLLPDAAGRYPVKLVEGDRTVGRIVVVGPRRPANESGRKA
jgi:hypothetical protein